MMASLGGNAGRPRRFISAWWRGARCALFFLLGAAGCAPYIVPYKISTTMADRAQGFEPTLSAAGFKQVAADTPEGHEQLRSLPPLQVTRYTDSRGRSLYAYADPYYCNCVFRGNEAAYERLTDTAGKTEMAEQKLQPPPKGSPGPNSWQPLSWWE